MYLGGLLNGVPTSYIQFTTAGINITSPTKVTITAPTIALEGAVTMSQTLTVAEDATANGISLDTHVHGGVATGGGETGVPIP
jgi:phage baseplate assembly protein gpV